ncbi:hypothetical protein [Mesorhizobium sp.]|uniref:DUF1127 domain-containing protein n=1 Tax=Mesorhizobium sp. TaxID=1871066 RepID=UPI0025BBB286|nr:hypothetical protein [Mesorhizobium sp.]
MVSRSETEVFILKDGGFHGRYLCTSGASHYDRSDIDQADERAASIALPRQPARYGRDVGGAQTLSAQASGMLITAPHMIADVGLTRKQVEAEIAKPFWRG